ncbi:hypothetical protein ACO2Q3_10590 [Caulobacter sp. KR2-114]|uniref:hypothetical protein n=1 Tax=Caulobacter sp. KR2-114 TaxID=3400912 RepID=UPI003BFB491E
MIDPAAAWWRSCGLGALAAIDFEASGLPGVGHRTFPVEVGLSCVASGDTRAWLIRPTEEWLTWGWDPAAEAVHGISLDEALGRGRTPHEVLRELAAMARPLRVVSDSGLDDVWLGVLAAGARRSVPFEIQLVDPVLEDLAATAEDAEAAQSAADGRYPLTHRAGPDARRLAEVIRILGGYDQFP